MIIKVKYDKSTKQITVENDIKQIVLSVTDSTLLLDIVLLLVQ